jgi:hypothetical protein
MGLNVTANGKFLFDLEIENLSFCIIAQPDNFCILMYLAGKSLFTLNTPSDHYPSYFFRIWRMAFTVNKSLILMNLGNRKGFVLRWKFCRGRSL